MKRACLAFFITLITITMAYAIDPFSFPKRKIVVDGRELVVLIAKGREEREQGLSNVKLQSLKVRGIDGMLFLFEDDSEKTFQAWFMNFDLLLLSLKKVGSNEYSVINRKILNIGTTTKIKGKYVLEIPLTNNSLLAK